MKMMNSLLHMNDTVVNFMKILDVQNMDMKQKQNKGGSYYV